MRLSSRRKFAEMIFFLGWRRHKDDHYTSSSVLDLVHQKMDLIQSRPFLEDEYLRIFGIDNPACRSRDVFILVYWIKLEAEMDMIFKRLFESNVEEFKNFYYPIIHKLNRHHHFDGREELNVDLLVNPNGDEPDDVDDFPDYTLPPYWRVALILPVPDNLNQENFYHHKFVKYYIGFFKFLYKEITTKTLTHVAYNSFLTGYIKNTLEGLGYSYKRNFTNHQYIVDVYVHLFYKKEIRLIYQLLHNSILGNFEGIPEGSIEELLADCHLNIPMGVNHRFPTTLQLDFGEDQDLVDFLEDLEVQALTLNRVCLGPEVEIVGQREFFRRFWDMPNL